MKLVKKTLLAQLQTRADAFSAIVEAVVQSSEGITAQDVTAETIIEALQDNADTEALSQAQTALDTANQQLTDAQTNLETANDRVAELEAELSELEGLPAKNPAGIAPKSDAGENTDTIADFANKNAGDTEAILAQAKKEGLI